MEIKRYAGLLWQKLWLLLLCTALTSGTAYAVSINSVPLYESSTTLLINQAPSNGSGTDYNSLLASGLLANTYAQMLQETPIFEQVIKKLDLHTSAEALAGAVKVDVVRDTQLIVLTVTGRDPAQASAIANEIVNQFRTQNQDIQESRYTANTQSLQQEMTTLQNDMNTTQASLDALTSSGKTADATEQARLQTLLGQQRSNYTTLVNSLETVRLAEAQSTNNLVVVKDAAPEYSPVSPKTTLNTILAAIVGLMLAVGVVLVLDYFDDTLKSSDEVERVAGASIVGMIARIPGTKQAEKLTTMGKSRSSTGEAYRILRTNIDFAGVDTPIKALAVTSSFAQEGKSITVANLAVAIAQTGKRVIVIDTDLRRPTLHMFFQQSNSRGVTTALLSGGQLADHMVATSIPTLRLMPSGPIPANPAELLGSKRMKELIDVLKLDSDFLIFDTPPVLPVTDALLVAGICDATILVARSGFTKSAGLKKANDQLQQAGVRVLGVVLNLIPTGRHGSYYYYHYESRQGRDDKSGGSSKLPTPVKRGWSLFSAVSNTQADAKTHHDRLSPSPVGERSDLAAVVVAAAGSTAGQQVQ
jgi:capsular exopolysaccharide synthesis family protein